MATYYQRVDVYEKQGDGTFLTSPSFSIYDAFNFSIPTGTENVKDQFTFQLINKNNRYYSGESTLKIGDVVKVYMWKDATSPTEPTDLVFDGIIQRPDQTINDQGKVLTISGTSRVDYLFKSIVPINLTSTTLPEIIVEILKTVLQYQNFGNTGFGFKFVYDGLEYSASNLNGVSTTKADTVVAEKSDGTSFTETYSAIANYEQAIKLIEKYSSTDFVNDNGFPYIFYLDKENYFHWEFRDLVAEVDIELIEGKNVTQIKCKWKDEVINALILNCGIDPNNNGITTFVADYASITSNGAKWKYVSSTSNIAENLMNDDRTNNSSSFGDDSWYPTAYPYTTNWEATASRATNPTMTEGSTVTVSSNEEYRNAIRTESQSRGKSEGRLILDGFKDPKFKASMEIPLNNNLSLAKLYKHEIQSYNYNNNLRILELSKSFWQYEPDSQEDEAKQAEVS